MTQPMTFTEFQNQAQDFLQSLFRELAAQNIALESHWEIDHLCYRAATLARYEELKPSFRAFADLLIESPVNGRPIASYKLHTPIFFKDYRIDVVELPAPKPSKPIPEGFEHIEIVCDLTFSALELKYGNCKYDRSGLKKNFNQELEIALGPRNLKFHHLSLESVIQIESNSRVHEALRGSDILNRYKSYDPLVAGTYPLGLSHSASDIDLLMHAIDLRTLQEDLTRDYGLQPRFSAQVTEADGLPTLIVNFEWQGVPFEVFAQGQASVEQRGYRHFLIEERLLKWGGSKFAQAIHQLRKDGAKTEPAFAQALKLEGDPYLSLLNLQQASRAEIQQLLAKLNF